MGVVNAITNNRLMSSIVNAYRKNPAKAISTAAITSIAVKDGVGCLMYVTQSLNNKKIPDERRKFVAALDLTNGILMIAAQIGMFFAMGKLNEALFNKFFNSSFSKQAKKAIVTKYRMIQKKAGINPPSRKNDLYKKINGYEKKAYNVIDFITNMFAATVIGKRVIVPFIATPLADKVKKKMDELDGTTKPQENAKVAATEPEKKSENGQKLNITSTGLDTNLIRQYQHTLATK